MFQRKSNQQPVTVCNVQRDKPPCALACSKTCASLSNHRAISLLILLALSLSLFPVRSNEPQSLEQKATPERVISFFLLNAVYCGHWPSPYDWRSNNVVRIGILGKNPLGDDLNTAVTEFKARWFMDGLVIITNSAKVDDLADCHLIYLSDPTAFQVRAAVDNFAQKPVLLISSYRGFAERGGNIEISVEKGKSIKWTINLDRLDEGKIGLKSMFKDRASYFIKSGKKIQNKSGKGESS